MNPLDKNQRYKNVEIVKYGEFPNTWQGQELMLGDYGGFIANPAMLLIREAWHRGLDLEDLADGFGPGVGTHGDWSAIRDSSPEAINAMLTRALNFHFPTSGF